MSGRMPGTLRVLGLVAVALLLGACVKVDMDLEVSPENTVSGSAILAVDENVVELTGQSPDQIFQDLDLSDLPEGASVEPYEGDGFVGQQVNFEDVALSEFSGGETLGGSGEELSITRVGDEFHVDGRLDMSGAEFSTDQVPPGVLDSFQFRIAITFPGPVTESSGSVDGNTVTWEPRIGQNTEIRAVASAIPSGGSPWLLIVLVAAGALIVGAIAFLLLGRGRAVPAEGPVADAAAEEPIAGAPAVPPEGPITGPPTATVGAPPPGGPIVNAPAAPEAPTAPSPPPPPPGEQPPPPVEPSPVAEEPPADDEEAPPSVPPISG